MANICDSCQYFFRRKRPNCPYCGGPLTSDSRSEAELTAAGYSPAPGKPSTGTAGSGKAASNSSAAHKSQATNGGGCPIDAPAPEPFSQTSGGTNQRSSQDGFFGQFESAPGRRVQIPQAVFEAPEPPPVPDLSAGDFRPPRRRIFGTRAGLHAVNWSIVLRVLLVLGAVALIAVIWTRRYAILGWFFNLVLELIPLVLLIAILIWLFRAFFKG